MPSGGSLGEREFIDPVERRSHTSTAADRDGRLLVTDQQGGWRAILRSFCLIQGAAKPAVTVVFLLIEAARLLDQTMTAIKDGGRLMSLERIALQAALNFSAEVVNLQRNEHIREEKIDRKIRMLADQLDDALKD